MATKISDMTPKAANLAATDTLEINEGGTTKSVTGQNVIDAANSGFSTVYKTADETITNDTTLTDDTDLQFSVDANTKYAIQLVYYTSQHQTPDYKYAFSQPAGATLRQIDAAAFWGTSTGTYEWSISNPVIVDLTSGINALVVRMQAMYLTVGGTAGTFAYQWAQNTSSAFGTTLKEGSWMMYKTL